MMDSLVEVMDRQVELEVWFVNRLKAVSHLDPLERLEIRRRAGLQIDPSTAEVTWTFVCDADPYDEYGGFEEYGYVGRESFARAPGTDTWVWFGDLPDGVAEELWELHRMNLAAFIIYPTNSSEPTVIRSVLALLPGSKKRLT
jgi:hypothetical protein